MKKWQQDIAEQIACEGKVSGFLNRILPARRRFAQDTIRMAGLLNYAEKAIKPPATAKDRLMARLDAQTTTSGSFVVAVADRRWHTIFPGVKECQLSRADGRLSRLLKISKGFFLPPHTHREIEQALILEGRCYSGKVLLQQGDYFFAEAKTKHARVKAIEDCLILLIAHQ